MEIRVIKEKIPKKELEAIAEQGFGDFVKAVVDVGRNLMAVGGELHADMEALLLEQGSQQENLWGINFYPALPEESWLEFDSMINIRPSQGNRSRGVESIEVCQKINQIVKLLVG